MRRQFFYVCAGLLMLAVAFPAGVRGVGAQAGGGACFGFCAGDNIGMVAVGHVIYYMGPDGVSHTLAPVPGTSPIVAMTAQGLGYGLGSATVMVILENGDMFTGGSTWHQYPGNILGGATPARLQSFGALKGKYR